MAVGLDESCDEGPARRAVAVCSPPPRPLLPEMEPPPTPALSAAPSTTSSRLSVPDLCEIDSHMHFHPAEAMTISCGTVCVDPLASKLLVVLNKKLNIYQLPKGRKNIGEDFHAAALRETYEETGVKATLLPLTSCTRATRPTSPEKADDYYHHYTNDTNPTSGDVSYNRHAEPIDRICCTTRTGCAAARPSARGGGRPHTTDGVITTAAPPEPYLTDGGEEAASPAPKPTASLCSSQSDSSSSSTSDPQANEAPASSDPYLRSLATQYRAEITANITVDPDLALDFPPHTEPLGVVKYRDPQVSMPGTRKLIFFFAARADSTLALGAGAQEAHEKLAPEWVPLSAGPKVLRFWAEGMAVWKLWAELMREGRIGCGI